MADHEAQPEQPMTPAPEEPARDAASGPATKRPRRRLQFALSTFLLLIAALASWAAYWQTCRRTEALRQQLPGLRQISRQLRVSDPTQYAAVEKAPTWFDEHIWEVHLPAGSAYELCLSLENIESQLIPLSLETEAEHVVPIDPGRHTIEFRDDASDKQWSFVVLVDDQTVIEQTRAASWNESRSSTGASSVSLSEQQAVDKPLELFRRRLHVPTGKYSSSTPKGPARGAQLWIRTVNQP